MKQLLILTILFIIIPFFIFLFFNNKEYEEYIDTKKSDNIFVRVKIENTKQIKKIPLEDYVIGVVAGEMPVYFPEEALKAQAVAARSYVMKRIEYNKYKNYDVVNTVLHQVYLDDDHLKNVWGEKYYNYRTRIKKSVKSTKGECVFYNDKIADTLFFSTSSGFTENSVEVFGFDVPYLKSVESHWDRDVSPVFYDEKIFTKDFFCKTLEIIDCYTINVNTIETASTGRPLILDINGKQIKSRDIRTALNLRSTNLKITLKDNNIIINTKGFGHGVGMSQYGAKAMAEEGYTYDEILKHYYKNIEIKKIN